MWPRGRGVQQAPPGTASSNNLLKRLKKSLPQQPTTDDRSIARSLDTHAGPTAGNPFFSKKFAAKASTGQDQSSAGGGNLYSNASANHLSDYNSGMSGDERAGPTPDKPFFSKKFSKLASTNAPPRDGFDTYSEYESDSSPTKTMTTADSSLHIDGQLVGLCTDMCPASERNKRIDEKDVNRLELPYPKGYSEPNFKGENVDLSDPMRTMVKKLQRSAADHILAIPDLVRPPPVLLKSMRYLQQFVMEKDLQSIPDVRFDQIPSQIEVYLFVWDRLRMIAKDFILQNYRYGGRNDRYSVECYENMARWHIMMEHQMNDNEEYKMLHTEQNYEQLNRYLKSLNEIYDDAASRKGPNGERLLECPNESEFRAFYIFQQLDNEGQVEAYIRSLSAEVLASDAIQYALAVVAARRNENYAKFFRLIREGTYLEACSLFRYVGYMRIQALRVMCKIYRPAKQEFSYPLSDMKRLLLFDSDEDTLAFFEYCGLPVVGGNRSEMCVVLDGRNVIESLPIHKKSGAPVLPETRSMHVCIEGKSRFSRGEVTLGKASRNAVSYEDTGEDEQAFYRAQLLQKRQLPHTNVETTKLENTPFVKTDKRSREDQSAIAPSASVRTDSPLVKKASEFPAAMPQSDKLATKLMPSTKPLSPERSSQVILKTKPMSTAPIGLTSTAPESTKTALVLPRAVPPAVPFSFTTKQSSSETETEKKLASLTTAPSTLSLQFKPSTAPFVFPDVKAPVAVSTVAESNTLSDKPVSPSTIPSTKSGAVEPSVSVTINIPPPATPVVRGINAPSPDLGACLTHSEPSAPLKIYSLDDVYNSGAPNFALSSLKPPTSAQKRKSPVDEFDESAAAAKVVKAVAFTPRSSLKPPKAFLQDNLEPIHDEIAYDPATPERYKSVKENTHSVKSTEPRGLSEERVKMLMKLEYHLAQRVSTRRMFKAWQILVGLSNQQLLKNKEKILAVLFNKWKRVLQRRTRIQKELQDTIFNSKDHDLSFSMLAPFSRLSVVGSLNKIRPLFGSIRGKTVDLYKPVKLTTVKEVLQSASLRVAAVVGPTLFHLQTEALRAVMSPKKTERKTRSASGPIWPRSVFWKTAIISTDRASVTSRSGYFLPAEDYIITSVRALLCGSDYIVNGVTACAVNEDCRLDSGTMGTVRLKCSDYRPSFGVDDVSLTDMCHASIVMCPFEIIVECVETSAPNNNAASFLELVRVFFCVNSGVPIVLLITVAEEGESVTWGEIDMASSDKNPPWGISVPCINQFLDMLQLENPSERVKGVFAVNTGEISALDDVKLAPLARECTRGLMHRLATSHDQVVCPILQRIPVSQWVLLRIQQTLLHGSEDDASSMSPSLSIPDMIQLCITNSNKAVNSCLFRIEAEMTLSDVDAERAQTILANDFSIGDEGCEKFVPDSLLDDWEYTQVQLNAKMTLQKIADVSGAYIVKGSLSIEEATSILNYVHSILAYAQRSEDSYWLSLGNTSAKDTDTVRYVLPVSQLESSSKDSLLASHDFISSFWLPVLTVEDSLRAVDEVSFYATVLKNKGWLVSDTDVQNVTSAIAKIKSAESDMSKVGATFLIYSLISKWFYNLITFRHFQVNKLDQQGELSIYISFKSDNSSSALLAPKQLELLSLVKKEISTRSRKRPWNGSFENDNKDYRIKTRYEENIAAIDAEGGDALGSIYNQFYTSPIRHPPFSITCIEQHDNTISAANDRAEQFFQSEKEATRRLEDQLNSILRVFIPGNVKNL